MKPIARSVGLLDHPGGRKAHAAPTPLVGGLAIVAGCLPWALLTFEMTPAILGLVLASAIILAVGVLDDLYDLRWPYRLLGQTAAALTLVVVGGGVVSVGPLIGAQPHLLGPWSLPFTVVATVGLINAINMVDGVDGLAGGLAFVAMAMMVCAAIYSGNTRLGHGIVLMMAALMAFLAFNMRTPWRARADIFLGNAGSEFLGLVIAWTSFRLTQNLYHPVTPSLAPFFIAPALIDCLVLILRRIRSGRSPFSADRNHFHHLLVDAGLSPFRVVLVITGLSLLTGGSAALALKLLNVPGIVLVAGFLVLTLVYFRLSTDRARFVKRLSVLAGRKKPALTPIPSPKRPAQVR